MIKSRILPALLAAAFLICTITATASAEGVNVIYNYSAGSASTYSISIPSSVTIYDEFGSGFGLSATDVNVVDGYEVVVRINASTYSNDGIFYLFLNGDTVSSNKLPCTLIRNGPESGTQTLTAGEQAVIASFRGTSTFPYAWGSLTINPGHGSVSGRYSNMLYFDISVEEIA